MLYDLIEAEHPDAIRPAAPDAGADVVLWRFPPASGAPGRTEIFQAKHYPKTIDWDECVTSLKSALGYEPERITFVFSRDLSSKPLKTFKRRLVDPYPQVKVEVWTLSKLRAVLQRHRALRVRYCGPDQQTLMELLVEQKAPDLLDRLLDTARNATDPDFRYTAIVGESAALTPSAEVWVTLEYQSGDRCLRVLAERTGNSEDAVVAAWGFAHDEEGEGARHEALLAVAGGDEQVVIERGMTVVWRDAPKAIRDALNLASEQFEDLHGRLTLTPGPPILVRIVAHGETNPTLAFDVRPFPATDGFAAAYVGRAGALMPYLAFRLPVGKKVEFAYRPLFEPTGDARTDRDGMEFQLAFFRASTVEFSGPLFGGGTAVIEQPARAYDRQVVEFTEALHWVYDTVVRIEDRVGARIPVHALPYTTQEIEDLIAIWEMLRTGIGTGRVGELSLEVQPQQVDRIGERMTRHPQVVLPAVRDVLGQSVNLGRIILTLPDVRVVPLASLVRQSVNLKVLPVRDEDIEFRLLGAHERPPPDAITYNPPPPRTDSGIWLPPANAEAD